ncbi:glycosyltransferase family 39 protein [Dokdonella sp.]|uniref:ArnT family glycosyltransferase n=1 Tax=Dokdonella sp. TaxID=2291710 RepID=UPI0025BA8C83|nr:glycosyltransferase family 39 protein [Dokdonella sp.]MBX3693281.1 glycosyltransferase family 39 protein [Dokdonella sp.]MCW5568382.1 glycosyltransferase family 39 protein [Dokdonella sp.]
MDQGAIAARGATSVAAASGSARRHDARPWDRLFAAAFLLIGIAKVWIAATLPPFVDEAFYWQESRHLAWTYSDVPGLTAWLIAAGEALFGHSPLGMRSMFLVLGAALPWMVVVFVRSCFDARAGWQAGLWTLAMPLAGTLGVLALPDVPLTWAALLALLALDRALRSGSVRAWSLVGFALALAWLAHYRAAMLLAAGLVFFVVMPRGRAQWRRVGVWLALAISALGLLPLLVFNVTHAWRGLGFQFVERHPWAFHADALVQPLEQALVVTPVLFAALLAALVSSWRRRHEGAPWDLIASIAGATLLAWFVLGLFADSERFRVHWPLQAWLFLIAVLPMAMRAWPPGLRRGLGIAGGLLAAIGGVIVLAWFAAATQPWAVTKLAQGKVFPNRFVGWNEAGEAARRLIANDTRARIVLVADNFMLAAELDFALGGKRPVFVLDSPLNARHGRAMQLSLWQRDEQALRALAGSRVLLAVDETALRERDRAAWLAGLCTRIAALEPVERLDLYGGRKRIAFLTGVVPGQHGAPGCAYPFAATGSRRL